jgi:hypothetical protein
MNQVRRSEVKVGQWYRFQEKHKVHDEVGKILDCGDGKLKIQFIDHEEPVWLMADDGPKWVTEVDERFLKGEMEYHAEKVRQHQGAASALYNILKEFQA